jgi:hypothetical protein
VHHQIAGQLHLPEVVKALSEFSATRKNQAQPGFETQTKKAAWFKPPSNGFQSILTELVPPQIATANVNKSQQ